jgi:aminopeptidase-like protein
MRTMYQRYKEYHTSLDNKSFISFEAMEDTVETYFQIAKLHELNRKYVNAVPYGEPQLGKRGLYPQVGGQKSRSEDLSMRLHLLSWADGEHDLIAIAERFGKPALEFEETVRVLVEYKLLS